MDFFRPHTEPALSIYNALLAEAARRQGRPVAEWTRLERLAVWQAAHDYAEQHGLAVPTLDQVAAAERQAVGHVDYAAKWAYGVVELLKTKQEVDE